MFACLVNGQHSALLNIQGNKCSAQYFTTLEVALSVLAPQLLLVSTIKKQTVDGSSTPLPGKDRAGLQVFARLCWQKDCVYSRALVPEGSACESRQICAMSATLEKQRWPQEGNQRDSEKHAVDSFGAARKRHKASQMLLTQPAGQNFAGACLRKRSRACWPLFLQACSLRRPHG